MPDPFEWLVDCADVPIECQQCNMITTLGGYLQPEIDFDNPDEVLSDLCGCDAPFRIFVGDAPKEHVGKLATLLDVMEILEMGGTNNEDGVSLSDQREHWTDTTRDDLEE